MNTANEKAPCDRGEETTVLTEREQLNLAVSPAQEALTLDESKRKTELEAVIEAGQQTFREVGDALAEIRDSRLYKSNYASFEDYCVRKWGFGKSYGYQLIESAASRMKFTRDELRAHDPEMFTLLAKLWRAPERMGSATSPPRKTAAAFLQAPVLFHTPEADAIYSALEVFPPDNPWNQLVDKWPRHPHSDAIIASIGRDKPFRYNPDMGFVLVPPDQPRVPVKIVEYPGESDPGPFPVPENIPIEGWPAWHQRENAKPPTLAEVQRRPAKYEGDRHAIVVDPVNRMLYEFFTFGKTADGWAAGQASVFDLKSNMLRPTGWTSADAAGLPIFPAVVRYDEIRRGQVEHALRVTVTKTRREFVSPATHFASRHDNADYPRMGERIRLKQDFDISGFSPTVQAILKGLKRYGMFVADNGIDWAISVAPDPRLPVLHEELRKIKGADFEVVIAPE